MALGRYETADLIKLYRNSLNLNDSAKILSSTDDPTSVAKDAPKGSLLLRTGASGGAIYRKTDDGSSTNWAILSDSILTTKGDILSFNTASARLGVGSDTQVLTADSSQSLGIKWADIPSALPRSGAAENIGLSLSSGVLSLTQADGSALSTGSNSGFISIFSTTAGQIQRVGVTAPHTIEDASGTSDLTGEEFGTTAGVAWGNTRPLYLYAVYDGTDLYFALSPNPAAKVAPAAANIGYKGNPASTPSDSNFMFMTGTDVTSSHALAPCVLIGGVLATKDSSDDWTFQTLSNNFGGNINPKPFENIKFTFPQGQMGAASNSYFNAVSGTIMTWATPANVVAQYTIDIDGTVTYFGTTEDAGNCTAGTSTDTADLYLPYVVNSVPSNIRTYLAIGAYRANGAGATAGVMVGLHAASSPKKIGILEYTLSGLRPVEFSGTNNSVHWHFSYKAF